MSPPLVLQNIVITQKIHLKKKKCILHNRAIMLSHSGLQDNAVEELVTNVLKHAPGHSKLQVQIYTSCEHFT